MTPLKKPLRRQVHLAPRGGSGTHLEVIITLYPGGMIGLRDKGRRKEYTLPLTMIYCLAAEAEARRMIAERKVKRKGRK